MANFCLPSSLVKRFTGALKTGDLDPAKLASISSQERHAAFSEILGEDNAKAVNALFESKLLLKHQQEGMINWAKQVAGMKGAPLRDFIARVEKMTEILDPKQGQGFLEDLAAQRLGFGVTQAEASHIADLSKQVTDARVAMEAGGDRMTYGRAKVDLADYVNGLKADAGKKGFLESVKSPGETLARGLSNTAGLAKSVKASFDDSAIFRQGWKTMFTNPGTWAKNAALSFSDFAKAVGGKNALREVDADIVSRPNYDLMRRAKLAVGKMEEAYPTALPERLPILGRVFKGSEQAYTGFLRRMRADVFDKYIDIAKKSGVNLSDPKELEAIGSVVNSLTGRANFGKFEGSAVDAVNSVFFSPRNLVSHFDVLTAHSFRGGMTTFARKQAAKNLVKVLVGQAAILGIAHALDPKAVELDPRSADFGKIRVGNSRFDVSGGSASMVTLAARLMPILWGGQPMSKSSTTGKLNPINAKDKNGNPAFGAQTGGGVAADFFSNKFAPATSVVRDLLRDQDSKGKKPTFLGETGNLLVPLPITTTRELMTTPGSAPVLLGMLADSLGISTNTYAPAKKK